MDDLNIRNSLSLVVLPEIKLFRQDWENHGKYIWSDHYGAIITAEKYTQKSIPMNKPFQYFGWLHGSMGPWRLVHPGLVNYNHEKKFMKYFVATLDEERYLRKSGFLRAKAIGLPIIYQSSPNKEKIPKSLLIMPAHTLTGVEEKDKEQFKDYVTFIKQHLDYFETVAVCLHHSCITNNLWVEEFKELGIPIIVGARTDDENALSRQLHLFEQFETVTSNAWGSHIAYALYCNCKVSIIGPFRRPSEEAILKTDATWRKYPETLKLLFSKEVERAKDEKLQHLYVDPCNAVYDKNLGDYLVGLSHKLSPKDLYSCMKPGLVDYLVYLMDAILWRLNYLKHRLKR